MLSDSPLTKIYADSPDYRLLTELVDELRRGAIFIYPTASGYAYCCDALHQRAIEEICRLKKIDPKKKALSIACASLSQVSEYCKMNDRAFKFIKDHEVNYTFILPASSSSVVRWVSALPSILSAVFLPSI